MVIYGTLLLRSRKAGESVKGWGLKKRVSWKMITGVLRAEVSYQSKGKEKTVFVLVA